MWRHGVAGALVVGSGIGLMLVSFEAESPILSGWTARHAWPRIGAINLAPASLAHATARPTSFRIPVVIARQPKPPDQDAATPSPSSAEPFPSPAPKVEPHAASVSSIGRQPLEERPVSRAPESQRTRRAVSRLAPGVGGHLLAAQRQLVAGDMNRAGLNLQRAEALLTFRPGQADARLAAEIAGALNALAAGDQVMALRHLDHALYSGRR